MNRALDRWGVFEFFDGKTLMTSEAEPRVICLTSSELVRLSKFEPAYAGLVIGELKRGFTPSLPGADLFARFSTKKEYYVTVNDNAEKLVLYGRDVMGDSIADASEDLDENELVILLNGKREAIGLGRTRFTGKSIRQAGRITITTILDAGSYLRDEG